MNTTVCVISWLFQSGGEEWHVAERGGAVTVVGHGLPWLLKLEFGGVT